MKITTLTPTQALHPAYRKVKIVRQDIDRLKAALPLLLDRTTGKVSESTLRDHFQTFLRHVAFPEGEFLLESEVNRMDTVIHDGPKRKDPVGVIIEAKTSTNTNEMFSPGRPNVKALHELVLYFMRERAAGNVGIKSLMITNGDQVYVFPDGEFERLFWNKKRFRKKVLELDADGGKNNPITYEAIGEHIDGLAEEAPLSCAVTHLNLFRHYCEDGDPATDDKLLPLYKLLSPEHLLRRPFAGDSNHLDKGFYRELLHIIGLHEVNKKNGKIVPSGGKKVIERLPEGQRHPASLLENTLQVAAKENRFRHVSGWRDYGSDEEDRRFGVALELCLTWVNRILFLKLLETQLASYHQGHKAYQFLSPERIPDFDALNTLFFDVLNKPVAERESIVADFARVPYLNSSLFEISALEDQVIRVNSLKDQFHLPLAPQSVLRTRGRAQNALPPLEYLFAFLDAYDFGGEGRASIQEDNKRLINASVLGLIFEKINGYRDGSFYTPGFITEYMCRQTIRRAVVQKFRDDQTDFADFDADDFDALRNYLRRDSYQPAVRTAANALVNSLTVCDPAVGSGHFLVSALNELIATKSELGILGADAGAKDVDISAEVENDELLLSWRRDGEPYEYRVDVDSNGQLRVPPEIQAVQETLFQEKRTLIENCLFGVDLNPNSVKICRLRLWIELLKNAYYVLPDERSEQSRAVAKSPIENRESRIAYLQTLPNIDINIKQGNSLISRFALDDDLSDALKDSDLTLADYRRAVTDYHRAQGRDSKEHLLALIESIKNNFQTHIGRNDKRVKDLAKARGKLTQLESLLEVGDLFGAVDEKSIRQQLQPVAATVEKLETELSAVRDNAIYEQAFEWRFEFPAVLGEDGRFLGFDVVVGNPPYIRQEELTEVKPYLQAHYEVYAGTADLLVYFIELSMKNLRENGQFSFIISNKFMRAGFGKALRKYIPQYRVHELLDFGDLPVFDGATTYPLVISLEKAAPTGTFLAANLEELARTNFRNNLATVSFESLQSGLTEEGWNLADVATQKLLGKLKNTGVPLGEYVNGEIYRGVLTGFNEAFVIDAETRDQLIGADPKSAEVIKPFLAGRDVKRYVPPVAEKYLIFTRRGIDIEAYPVIKRHLETYRTQLEPHPSDWKGKSWPGRKPGPYKWYEIQDSVNYYEEFDKPKIFIPAIVKEPSYSFDTDGQYGNDKTTIIPLEDRDIWLLALLNSQAVDFYLQSISSAKRGGYFEYKPVYISALPILEPSTTLQSKLSDYVTSILHQKSLDPTADTSALEAEIDVLVYKLYGLTYAEVLVVDAGFGMGEGAYAKITVA